MSRPLRIIHLTVAVDGAPWMIGMAREQRRRGHEVAVILPSRNGSIAPALEAEGIPYHLAPCDALGVGSHFERARVILTLVRLLRRLRPDVIHSHLINSVVTARIAAWIADVPNRLGANAGPLTLESELLRPAEVGTAVFDTRTIASCSYTLELFARYGVPASQCDLVYYGPDHTRFDPAKADGARVRRELGIDDDTPLVGIVAYFYAPSQSLAVFGPGLVGRGIKGHEVLLDAVPRILAQVPNAKFALVGRGWGAEGERYLQSLKERAKALGDAVLFPGERSDVPDTLAAFDVSVHPSLNDNLGGTIESLLMARPMVVSDIRGYEDSVLHEETGLVVPAGDSAALADAVVRFLRDRELARRLGENGRKRMLETFTLQRSVETLDAIFARQRERAEGHYRLATMIGRAVAMPFRLLPIMREVRRVQRHYHPPPRLSVRVKSALRRFLKPAPKARGRIRVAQVAGVWSDSDWFAGLCRDLTARGYDVIAVIDEQRGDLGARLEAAGIRCYRLALTFATDLDRARLPVYATKIPLAAIRLARILRREKIDIVHSHVFASVVVARLAAVLARARHVAGIPGPRHLEAKLTRIVDRRTLWMDDVTIAGCHYTRDLYAALGASDDRLACIYYGVDAKRFDPALADPAAARRALGIAAGAPLVVLVAHFYPPTRGPQTPPHTMGRGPKGHEDFLAAARIVAERFPEAHFVLAGGGVVDAGEAYRQQLMAAWANDRVLFAGHVDDVASLLAAADVVVQCSLTENLGGTIEALLMARPVVATRVGGMPESVRDGETGLLVPASDPAALASAIERLLEHREEAAAFGRAGRRLMLERFTAARTADDITAVYRRMVGEGVPA
ncbi:MAG TPA: glycosyltransferase family 4 protein [Thermoanaerobaculia bacterium]|jgi:glycosyltransferase involved in cell wall biosynthesis|nr:glycosyltransferase family 4 protein [Thermoanaerobaculia bacterium]